MVTGPIYLAKTLKGTAALRLTFYYFSLICFQTVVANLHLGNLLK